MKIKIECDRCGRDFYVPDEEGDYNNGDHMNTNVLAPMQRYNEGESTDRTCYIALRSTGSPKTFCPECISSFQKWFDHPGSRYEEAVEAVLKNSGT